MFQDMAISGALYNTMVAVLYNTIQDAPQRGAAPYRCKRSLTIGRRAKPPLQMQAQLTLYGAGEAKEERSD